MVFLSRAGRAVFFSLAFLFALNCKKSPTTPNAEILNRPLIWLNTFDLSFTAYEAGGNPEAQTLRIKNSGRNTLQYSIEDDAEWLSVEPANGTSTGQLVDHSILVNKAGLAARDEAYEATVSVVCNEAYNNPQRVQVSLKISSQPPPEIWVSPSVMTFSAKVGQNPPSQTLKVKNAGMGTLTYDISWDAGWLSVSPASGSSDGEAALHSVSVASQGLAEGTYSAAVAISSPDASNSPRVVAVSLEVRGAGPLPAENEISVACNPASAGTGTLISVPISILGNIRTIGTYGLELSFDSGLFDYVETNEGGLTGNWTVVDGYLSGPGEVTIGGFAGTGTDIPIESAGSIAVVTLRVKGAGYNDGHQSQLAGDGYTDDITGMTPQPATTTFTYQQ